MLAIFAPEEDDELLAGSGVEIEVEVEVEGRVATWRKEFANDDGAAVIDAADSGVDVAATAAAADVDGDVDDDEEEEADGERASLFQVIALG